MEKRGDNEDRMTSLERINALFSGKPIDRVPLLLFEISCGIGWFCAKNMDLPMETTYNDPEKSFQAQVQTREQYGYDSIPVLGYASYGAWEFGGEIKYPTTEFEQAPQVTRHPVEAMEDVDSLELPDVRTAGMLPLMMQFSKLQEQQNGMPITFPCGGPFTYAGNIVGIDKLARWTIKEPELVHRLLRLCTDHIIEVAQLWVDTYRPERLVAHEILPLEANTVISPKHFEKFALPYLDEVHNKVLAMGVKRFSTHICGEQNRNLSTLSLLPMGDPGMVSFGLEVSLTTAIEYFGDKCVIAGNVDPTVLQTGTSQEVYELSRKCIEEAKNAPRGYILAPGCDLSPLTPPENIQAMVKAIEDFGRYDAYPSGQTGKPNLGASPQPARHPAGGLEYWKHGILE